MQYLKLVSSALLALSASLIVTSCNSSVKSPVIGDSPPAGYTISVSAGEDQKSSSVTLNDATGHPLSAGSTLSDRLLSEDDLRRFGINGNPGIGDFLRDIGQVDTVYGCVQDCDGWSFTDHPERPPVKIRLTFLNAQIIEFHADNTALASEKFTNDSSLPATYTSNLSVSKTNSSTTSWSDSNSFTFSQSIKYQIGFLGTGGGGSTGLSYNHTWGEGGSETASTTIGTTSGVTVTLQPKQNITATLSATQGTMRVRITYLAALTDGAVTTFSYDRPYHLPLALTQRFMPLEPLLSSAGRQTSVKVTQDIDVGYFSSGRIEIRDTLGNILPQVSLK